MRGSLPLLMMLNGCAFLDQGDLALRRSLSTSADVDTDTDTDTDTDSDTDTGTDTSWEKLGVSGVDIDACQNGNASLSLRSGGSGVVVVDHKGYSARSCADLVVTAAWEEGALVVRYTDEGKDTCDDECPFRLRYDIVGVPSGRWVVDVMGEPTEELTVE